MLVEPGVGSHIQTNVLVFETQQMNLIWIDLIAYEVSEFIFNHGSESFFWISGIFSCDEGVIYFCETHKMIAVFTEGRH